MSTTKHPADMAASDVDLAEGIDFQLRYLGSTRIFRYSSYHFRIDRPLAVFFFLTFPAMFVLHSLTLVYCGSLSEFTDLMYVFGIQINELFKMYDLVSNSDRIGGLLAGLHESRMYPRHWQYGDRLRAAQRHVRISSLLLYVSAIASALMVFVSALFKHHTLPFSTWFPMRTDRDLGYWMAYSMELAYVFYLTPINITLDTFLTGLLHFAAVKLDILRTELELLGSGSAAATTCEQRMQRLREVIVFHQEIAFMIKEIEDIFNRGIFVQCITCGSTLCIVGYRMLLTELFSNDFIASVLLLTAFLGEIFYYCHYGNQIKVKADELCNAVYASRWYVVVCRCAGPGGRHPHQRALMSSISIIMERIKRPTHVTAGNLVKLTYETFIAICKGGFQAFAVLRDMQLK